MDLNDALLFAKVAELKGISAAARALGLPKSRLSRRIAALEQSLQVRLLERTTRSVALTDAGRQFYQHCRRIQEESELAQASLEQLKGEPRGRLTISASVALGQHLLAPHLGEFMARYPAIEVVLRLDNRRVDLVQEGIDLAVRVGALEDSSLICRQLASAKARLYAAPSYLAQHGTPEQPEALSEHRQLVMTDASQAGQWPLQQGAQRQVIELNPVLRCNDITSLVTLAQSGTGIVALPDYLVRTQREAGTLVSVLPGWSLPSFPIHLLFPSHLGLTHKARLWCDFVAERLPEDLRGS
ncbi:LysR family transcriptional regulator [Ferrimonas marina]|uniref:DNA-binding transcriptional regulator, LysR family n=1 Tax=Ferrimonas marina TaxID=299255 RepID=A0A1M5RY01_9GAMM|nr:LysR family transcriptional regulator [Ferrimonas marina]SHH30673.1 DNA-binding transcriptional regulator, LysR family [Ferrimonas marina]